MKKINNSNFELIEDIIKSLDFNYNQNEIQWLNEINKFWKEIVGNKISKYTKVYEFSADNQLTILCADSFISNELFFNKTKILHYMNEKSEKMGIKIEDIRLDYRKWKERSNE